MNNRILLFFLSFFLCTSIAAQFRASREFENIDKDGVLVSCFFQDEFDQVWAGTGEGMYTCNEKVLEKHLGAISGNLVGTFIHSFLRIQPEQFYVGTGNGLYLFDLRANTYTLMPGTRKMDIRSIGRVGEGMLWLGTLKGLVQYTLQTNTAQYVKAIQSQPVYSLADANGENVYISSINGIYKYDAARKSYSFISLPSTGNKPQLIISMAFDPRKQCVWIGTENDLFKYDIHRSSFERKTLFSQNSLKTILPDSKGNLWLGTDNGLYIYNEEENTQEYFVHSSRNNRSLINNNVWGLFEDRKNNIWIGTDCGISLFRNNRNFQVYRWEDIVHSDEGNRITAMLKDSRGNYWLGGTNGLVRWNPATNSTEWYKMRDSRYHISHNRIRNIYEDRDHLLWVATDGGVNRFDYQRSAFVRYYISDSTRTQHANWCYSIFEDKKGRLWIGANLGGLFVVNKEKLLKQGSDSYLAEVNYSAQSVPALTNDRILYAQLAPDGTVWASGASGTSQISANGKKIDYFPITQGGDPQHTLFITCMYLDTAGTVWVGSTGMLERISPQTGKVVSIRGEQLEGNSIQSIVEKGEYLWLTLPDGIVAMNKKTHTLRSIRMDISRNSRSYLDPDSRSIWIGGIDQLTLFNPDSLLAMGTSRYPVVLTTLYINDKPLRTGEAYDGTVSLTTSPEYAQHIRLNHNQNNLAVEFAESEANEYIQSGHCYRLENVDKDWRVLHSDVHRISYSNLSPGEYTLYIQEANDGGSVQSPVRELHITVLPPWYGSIWAKVGYMLLGLALLAWAVNYFRVWSRLRIARIEKEKVMELSNLKMEFLTNVSHELKTPLSLILGPVNKLLATSKSSSSRDLLQTIHRNTMRLSTLVHQIIDIREVDSSRVDLSLASLEIVEFVRSITGVYRETCESKGISIQFVSDVEQLYIQADVLKMESIVNNLLSNACKFTPDNGEIRVTIRYRKEEAPSRFTLTVADSGVGIPAQDLPHIFSRFYQSHATSHLNKEGSGIGLSMVKSYVALHQGEVTVTSDEGKGTTFTVTLPVMNEEVVQTSPQVADTDLTEMRGLHILIVEDNVEIARFIADSLKGMQCTVVHNGKAGVEAAQRLVPDLIIADIMMPIMDGIEMSRLIRRGVFTSTIPIILLTAKDDPRTETDAYKLGVDAFISKPFEIHYLVTRIRQLAHKESLRESKLRNTGAMELREEEVSESQDEKFLSVITQTIEEHLQNPDLNVQKLAELSGYNAKQIYRRLKALTGQTAVDYIKSIRLKKAAILLAQRKFTVAEVMYTVGFSSHSYFSKCFSEKYGKSPKSYMEEC